MITFNHSGNMGDILFSLYFCTQLAEKYNNQKFNFNIQTNVKDPDLKYLSHPFGDVRMTKGAAQFIKSLLECQPYINKLTINDNVPTSSSADEVIVNLDIFRQMPINFMSGDIRSWYYNIVGFHLPRAFYKPILHNLTPYELFKDKIIFIYTERYKNIMIDYKALEHFKEHLVFMGLPKEYQLFRNNFFPMEYYRANSLKEIAELMLGAKGLVGNQSGLYTVAECLKIPRILLSPEFISLDGKNKMRGPVNNHPIRRMERSSSYN